MKNHSLRQRAGGNRRPPLQAGLGPWAQKAGPSWGNTQGTAGTHTSVVYNWYFLEGLASMPLPSLQCPWLKGASHTRPGSYLESEKTNKPNGRTRNGVAASVEAGFTSLALAQIPSHSEAGRCMPCLARGPRGRSGLLRGRGDTHGKLVLGVHRAPAHRPGVVEPLHVVGFIKAARQEEAEAPSCTPAADAEPALSLPSAAPDSKLRPGGVLAATLKTRLSWQGE